MTEERIEDIKKSLKPTPQESINYIEDVKTLIQIGLDQLEGNPEYYRDNKLCESGYVYLKTLDKEIKKIKGIMLLNTLKEME